MLKKLKPADYIIIAFIALAVCLGGFAVSKKKNFSNLPVEKEAVIMFDVFFRSISVSAEKMPFQTGDDAFITIRNVPYKKMKIAAIDGRPRLVYVPAANKQGYTIAEDVSSPGLYDFIVRFEDTAKKTSDGYVSGGNKIKMGLPVIIEGELYRYQGAVSNIFEVPSSEEKQ